ncbi:hypothetical protein ES288_A11G358000v1 [Gossypium darwinii]|uniref:Uncharacterized protein n=1 Tax=Gossypium darwinii TaxID=34276 RepID=A0A5D2ESG5_GOSDA|nr:hypothetical protein ES288_A11G358000v1 [Gossypium darwinii]
MGKDPGLYTEIGKKARDLLYKDYQTDQKFTLTTSSLTGVAITPARTKKGDLFLTDVNSQLKSKNVTTDIKVDTSSNLNTFSDFGTKIDCFLLPKNLLQISSNLFPQIKHSSIRPSSSSPQRISDPLEEGFKLRPIANRGQLVKKFGIDHKMLLHSGTGLAVITVVSFYQYLWLLLRIKTFCSRAVEDN